MLGTLIVCLSGCGAPASTADEAGRLSASYLQACHEMHYLKRSHCPEIDAPVLLRCTSEIERQLPSRFRDDFRRGTKVLEQRLAQELPPLAERRFSQQLEANGKDAAQACYALATENAQRRLQLMRQLQSLGRN